MINKLVIAAAGSGKTTYLVNRALEIRDAKVLITTFTLSNENEIRKKIININGCVPSNITIQTWFSFLLQHGVRPYQGYLFEDKINGLLLVNSKSGLRYKSTRGFPIYWGEDDVKNHYFTKNNNIYSDKISKFVVKCNNFSNGSVVNRISQIYQNIFVDEVQDLAGYDLEIIKLLLRSDSNMLLVGDPRQVTYMTHFADKHKKYNNGKIKMFIEEKCNNIECDIDEISLAVSHRNKKDICNVSSKLYDEYTACVSANLTQTDHDGIFFIDDSNISDYMKQYSPVQLRLRIDSRGPDANYSVYNFGDSKGLTFGRTIIFPTEDMEKWLKNHNQDLAEKTRAQFYVALTRAVNSVGIYLPNSDFEDFKGLNMQSWPSSSS